MSDYHHYEYAEARHDHRGDYADERHDHDLDYAEKHHRHYDERAVDEVRRELRMLRDALNEYERDLADARRRIADLERLRPTCVICLDATATQQIVHGPACSDCVGEPPGTEVDHHPYGQGQDPDPEPEEYDPGPEIDDEGGMSEYRYVLPEDYERGQS